MEIKDKIKDRIREDVLMISQEQTRLALDTNEHWRMLHDDQKLKLKNAEEFIKLLMQQLEQSRRERDKALTQRDQVTQEFADVLKDLLTKGAELV